MVEVLLSLAALFESNSTLVLLKLINFNSQFGSKPHFFF